MKITNTVDIPDHEIEWTAIRAQGAGGQNVNKVSSAVHLRFDISASSLPEFYKQRLMNWPDSRISGDGVVVIKAQQHRTQEKNRADALERLKALILAATVIHKQRKATRPSKSSQQKRMDGKSRRGEVKKMRGKVDF